MRRLLEQRQGTRDADYGDVHDRERRSLPRSLTIAGQRADTRLARKASLYRRRSGLKWVQVQGGDEVPPRRPAAAGSKPGGPPSKVGFGAFGSGSTGEVRKGNTSYAYSSTLVFPDEATAKAWVAIRASKAYIACHTRQADVAERNAHAADRVVASSLEDPRVGSNDYEGFTRYEPQTRDTNGKYVTAGVYDNFLYRHGRVVVNIELDRSMAKSGDVKDRVVGDTVGAAIAKVLARAAQIVVAQASSSVAPVRPCFV